MEKHEKARIIDGQYKVVHAIKKGGFGIIYFGWDLFLDKPIAIKEILPDLLGEAKTIDMFRDEAVNTAKLAHSNIVQIHNLRKTSDNRFFMIMEYIDGIDLRRLIERCVEYKKPIPFYISCFIVGEICKALEYAHNKRDVKTNEPLNIIHRDVSPSNIMITSEGTIKLIDFGIAKARFRRSETRQGLIKGKISYISPEQILGEEIDKRSDLFSLGIVFYELLTLTKPFQGNSDYTILQAIVKCKYNFSKLTKKEVPDQLVKIVKNCLKDKENRYKSANDIFFDIDKFLITKNRQELEKDFKDFIHELFYDDIIKQYTIYSKAAEEEPAEVISTNDITQETPSQERMLRVDKDLAKEEEDEVFEGEEEPREERTIADIIRLADRNKKRQLLIGAGGLIGLWLLFLIMDIFFFRWTSFGEATYNKLNPPMFQILSVPSGATVLLDGKAANKLTPALFNKIEHGTHQLHLQLAGYSPIVRSFHIESSDKKATKSEPKKFIYHFETKVKIESNPPNAEVWLSDNKRYPRRTPCELTCEVGDTLSIKLIKEDFLPADNFLFYTGNRETNSYNRQMWSIKDIQVDNIYELQIQTTFLKPVNIRSTPSNAVVYIDGGSTPIGETNLLANLTVGEHKLEVQKNGYVSTERVISVGAATEDIFLELYRILRINVSSKAGSNRDIGATIRYIRPYRSSQSVYRHLVTPATVNLKSQRYRLSLSKPGYIDTVIVFTPRTSNLNIKMRPENPFYEFIVINDKTEKPISNCIIRYRPIQSGSAAQTLRILGKTDDSGRFQDQMGPGQYEVQFDKSGSEIKTITIDLKYNVKTHETIRLKQFR